MITRRKILQAGASVALTPIARLVQAAQNPGSFSFSFFSDTHIGESTNIHECRAMFDQMALEGFAFGINGGDITDYGRPAEYTNYRNLIKDLPFQIHTAPGNHDVRWSPLGPVAYKQGTGNPMYSSFDHKGVHLVMLDSTIPLSHYGHFERKMLQWLEQDLKHVGRDTPVFIAFHHWVGRDGNQLDNEIDLLKIIEPYNVKILLNGHGHSDLLWTWNGIANVMNKGLYQSSYSKVDIDRDQRQVRLTRRTERHPGFATLITLPLAPSREKRSVWPSAHQLAASSVLTAEGVREYRWDDRPWKQIPESGVPTDHLVEGWHRLTVKKDAQTYFHAGLIETRTSPSHSAMRKRWERQLDGGVMSHLRLAGDTLFVSLMNGQLCAYHAETGKTVWTAKMGDYCHSSPLILEDTVIVGSADENVYCFERASGHLRWKFKTDGPVYASGAEAGGIAAIGSGDGRIYGLDVKTGELRWKFELPQSPSAFVQSPAATDGERFYFGAWDKYVYALHTNTGELAWKHDCCGEKTFAYSPAIGGPAVGNGKVYIPTDGNLLFAFEADSGKVLWQTYAPGDKVGYSGPCLVGDQIFIGCLGDIGQARCFSAHDGSILWTADIGSTIYDSSPSYCDGKVAIGSVIGLLSIMSAKDGQILGQYQLPPGHFLASPVSAQGRVYAASYSNHLVAFDVT